MFKAIVLAAAVWATVSTAMAQAQLSLLVQPDRQSGVAGDVLPFSGTLHNPGPSFLYFNSLAIDIDDPDLQIDDTPFVLDGLAAGESWSGTLLRITIGPGASPGDHEGTFLIRGGTDRDTTAELAGATFGITVNEPAAVPEPSSPAVMMGSAASAGLLFVLIAAARRRYRNRRIVR